MNKIKKITLLTHATFALGLLIMVLLPTSLVGAQSARQYAEYNCPEIDGRNIERQNCITSTFNEGFVENRVRGYCSDLVGGTATPSEFQSQVESCVDSVRSSFLASQDRDDQTRQELRESGSFEPGDDGCEVGEGEALTRDNCGIINYIVILINFLSALAMMAIVASVMFAGYQYMTARDNPSAVGAAKQRIVWALVALAIFVFGYAILNFLVPGGVL